MTRYARPMTELTKADEALVRAWGLGMDDAGYTDAVMDEMETLLPILIEAGYAESDPGHTWNFTPKGVARAEELEGEDSPEKPFMRDLRKVAKPEDRAS